MLFNMVFIKYIPVNYVKNVKVDIFTKLLLNQIYLRHYHDGYPN